MLAVTEMEPGRSRARSLWKTFDEESELVRVRTLLDEVQGKGGLF
jgi:hypothetical protein